jgi:hypothetical protein
MFRGMFSPRRIWLYLQYLVVFPQVAAGWFLGWVEAVPQISFAPILFIFPFLPFPFFLFPFFPFISFKYFLLSSLLHLVVTSLSRVFLPRNTSTSYYTPFPPRTQLHQPHWLSSRFLRICHRPQLSLYKPCPTVTVSLLGFLDPWRWDRWVVPKRR